MSLNSESNIFKPLIFLLLSICVKGTSITRITDTQIWDSLGKFQMTRKMSSGVSIIHHAAVLPIKYNLHPFNEIISKPNFLKAYKRDV